MVRTPQRVWFLVVPRTGMLNVAGPWEVLGHANDLLGQVVYEMEAYGPAAPETRTQHGLILGGIRPLPEGPDDLPDLVLMAGASPQDPLPSDHAALVPWLRQRHERIPTVVSICTGAFILGRCRCGPRPGSQPAST